VLGASYDTIEANAAFATKFRYPFRLLCDVDRSLGEAYGADDPSDPGYPRRISDLIGPDRRILKVDDPVHVGSHATDVLRDV
jgi:peroxiredoxin Q/BCP